MTAKTVTMVDKAAKSYAVAPFDAMGRQGEAMRQRFTAMPEEQRKKIVGEAADAKVKPTGKSETILGRPAKEYEIGAGARDGPRVGRRGRRRPGWKGGLGEAAVRHAPLRRARSTATRTRSPA